MSGIMPMVNVPDTVQYGRVQAHLVAFIADTLDDDDQIPDEIPLEGVVVLTPTVGVVRFPTTAPPRTAVVQALRCPIIGGDLYPPDTPLEGPLPGTPGVVVVASDQPAGLPDTVQWTATFELVGARVQPSSVTFEVPSGGVVDLTTAMPATPTPGTVVVVSTEDRERAEAAAGAATQKASAATASATAAATSATNAASSATAAQTARDTTLAAAILELRGTGQPGSTTATNDAPVGTYYTDTVGTNGAWRWLKTTTGSGVSRWRVVAGEVSRDLSAADLNGDWTPGTGSSSLRLTRSDSVVSLVGVVNLTAELPSLLLTLPEGFRPIRMGFHGQYYRANTTVGKPVQIEASGNVTLFDVSTITPGPLLVTAVFSPPPGWPTTLPGTPA